MSESAALFALSPLDGRYAAEPALERLRDYFSEFALMRDRVRIEIAYLRALAQYTPLLGPLAADQDRALVSIAERFASNDARRIQARERETRHDVKAVEYYLREELAKAELDSLIPWLHFGLTSDDVNQTALAISLRESRDQILLPALDMLQQRLGALAREHAAAPMLARTHGQPAVPTTLGKELVNFYVRLRRQRARLARHRFAAKLTGAVGNFNAMVAAAPQVDWAAFSERFISSLGLQPQLITTQILPYDNWIEYFDAVRLTNSILLDLAQDLWRYVSDEILIQRAVAGEVGSSTMPHKVNPIDFENAEGNLGLANALFAFYSAKLPVSRLQRDLSDSTVRRTFGVALGHTALAWSSLARGLERIAPNPEAMRAALHAHWQVVSEGAQTILRTVGQADAYEQLRALSRGEAMTQGVYAEWVASLPVAPETRARLLALTPETYTGLAEALVARVLNEPEKNGDEQCQ